MNKQAHSTASSQEPGTDAGMEPLPIHGGGFDFEHWLCHNSIQSQCGMGDPPMLASQQVISDLLLVTPTPSDTSEPRHDHLDGIH